MARCCASRATRAPTAIGRSPRPVPIRSATVEFTYYARGEGWKEGRYWILNPP